MGQAYLIRYGLARSLGRFESTLGSLDRGQVVVIRSHRGTELGAVLGEAHSSIDPGLDPAPVLRLATPEDLERAKAAAQDRSSHFGACRAAFEGGLWPIELVDAEPLLDEGRTVIQYLGPHNMDMSGLVSAFRDRCGLDVVLEPIGRDIPEPVPEVEEGAHGCGSCGSEGGGCGSSGGGCGTSGGGCAVKSMIAERRRVAVDA